MRSMTFTESSVNRAFRDGDLTRIEHRLFTRRVVHNGRRVPVWREYEDAKRHMDDDMAMRCVAVMVNAQVAATFRAAVKRLTQGLACLTLTAIVPLAITLLISRTWDGTHDLFWGGLTLGVIMLLHSAALFVLAVRRSPAFPF